MLKYDTFKEILRHLKNTIRVSIDLYPKKKTKLYVKDWIHKKVMKKFPDEQSDL